MTLPRNTGFSLCLSCVTDFSLSVILTSLLLLSSRLLTQPADVVTLARHATELQQSGDYAGAAEAYRAMGGFTRAGLLMPIHWGLFNLALHAWQQPIERLLELETDAAATRLWLPAPGYPTDITPGIGIHSNWWKL